MEEADARMPQAINQRSKVGFQIGLGPHTESATVRLVMAELGRKAPERYPRIHFGVPYGDRSRQKCDLALGQGPNWDWLVEVKMLRMLGDNAKQNDNLVTHILSPYPALRSALTDCDKLAASGLQGRKAIPIYGYEADEWPVEPLLRASEELASHMLGQRETESFGNLVHPVHLRGSVHAWEIISTGPQNLVDSP